MEYLPGDIVKVIHTDTGMQFPECKVYDDGWSNSVIDLMAATWNVCSDEIFTSLYPNFYLELVTRNEDTA